ncbi:FecCD family ABC transporter permease [Treponema brennaborense]|uniref:ABC-type transporter, integral membrane subunit n=1 Tax=Treponema brennaborense (strain DSM 12168 / CIP 105900 / DD5/3) TaxID=906968 RepID=F4LLJ0_TREBD|nr:iron ABC transporter permease [Treponema brennaborense]AEE16654.1 ABC-type transporter, integral membrane subunit [Treponema brennaborense DSM 12168]
MNAIKKTAVRVPAAVLLLLLPAATALVCLGFGRYALSFSDTVRLILNVLAGKEVNATAYSVLFNVRLPRILLAASVGAGLACAGAAFQSLFTNPLATPDTLGVASGASFGAVLAMMAGGNLIAIQLTALVAGMVSCLLVYAIGRSKNKGSIVMVVLSGMVVSALFQALVSLLKYLADPEDQLPAITYWLMGSMAGASYRNLVLGLPFIGIGVVTLFLLRWRLNILSLSEDEAKSLGVNLPLLRFCVIASSSLITASCVSMCGQVGWVGLLVPHITRMISGSNNKSVVPFCISLGAVFMLVMDTAARSMSAAEIPLSILTAVIGAPFFISLLRKTGGTYL